MANDRISALENALQEVRAILEDNRERRDSQVGDIAVELSSNSANIDSLARRISALEDAVKPPSLLSVWGPAATSIALAATLFGAFLTAQQREQDSKLLVQTARMDSITVFMNMMHDDDNRQDAHDLAIEGRIAASEARQVMLEKQTDAVDEHGSRHWVEKK